MVRHGLPDARQADPGPGFLPGALEGARAGTGFHSPSESAKEERRGRRGRERRRLLITTTGGHQAGFIPAVTPACHSQAPPGVAPNRWGYRGGGPASSPALGGHQAGFIPAVTPACHSQAPPGVAPNRWGYRAGGPASSPALGGHQAGFIPAVTPACHSQAPPGVAPNRWGYRAGGPASSPALWLEFTARELGFHAARVGCCDFRADRHRGHDRRAAGVVLRQPGSRPCAGSKHSDHKQPDSEGSANDTDALAQSQRIAYADSYEEADSDSD